MSKAIIDTSAILASFYAEPGAEVVDAILRVSAISAVNAAEVISKLVERGMPPGMARSLLLETGVEVIAFNLDQAERVGALRDKTKALGLSLGDRACLALAALTSAPAVTADRAWASINDLDIEVILIRGNH